MNLRVFLTTLFTCSVIGIFFGQSTPILQEDGKVAEMTFEEVTFEYGQLLQGEKINNVFEFTNTGEVPLLITAAKGSCGCTVPEWPNTPIQPGETGEIRVVFDSKGKKGKQSKRVTLTANTNPAQTFLTIKGEVMIEEEKELVKNENNPAPIIKNEKVNVEDYLVYPNPTEDELRIALKNVNGQSTQIQIFDQLGALKALKVLTPTEGENILFDVSDYPPGKYAVSIKVEGKMRVAKQVTIL